MSTLQIEQSAALSAPPAEARRLERLRKTFFPTPVQGLISCVVLAISLWLAVVVLKWAVLEAVWAPNSAAACAEAAGACWSVITTRWRLIFFGLYPPEEQWRAGLASLILFGAVIASCIPAVQQPGRIITCWVFSFILFVALMGGGGGLTPVSSEKWSGLPLTLFIYTAVIVTGWPLSIVLALLRTCDYPVIRWVVALTVDLMRSLPLLTILFAFSLIIPLFMPAGFDVDKTYRVILGFALFFACYQSEIIRGGMQSIPTGQVEAAKALGMNYTRRMTYIVLPQVIRNTMPMSVNQLVISFKETSIIIIVGLFEMLAAAKSAFGTAEWNIYYKEVYLFIALIYFVFSYSMSRYGKHLERKMASPKSGTR